MGLLFGANHANELSWIKTARSCIGQKEIKGAKHNQIVIELWRAAFEATAQPIPAETAITKNR